MENPKALQLIDISQRIATGANKYDNAKYYLKDYSREKRLEFAIQMSGTNKPIDDNRVHRLVGWTVVSVVIGTVISAILGAINNGLTTNMLILGESFGLVAGIYFNGWEKKRIRNGQAIYEKQKQLKSEELDFGFSSSEETIHDPDVLKATEMHQEIINLNGDINHLNEMLKVIDDFRPLNDVEMKTYTSLVERRKKVGLKMIEVEKQLAAPKEVKALPPAETPTIPSIEILDRHQLEQEIEITIQKIEATDAERNAAVTHLDELNSQLDAMTGHRLLA